MSNKTVRERANAIERLERSSLSIETKSKRYSDIGLPSYSRSTTSSAKRASLSGFVENNNRIKRIRKADSPNRESSPTLSEVFVSSQHDEDNILCIALYAKLLQYQQLNWEMEQQFKKSEKIAETELAKVRQVLEELEFQEMQQIEKENSQNILDEICKQISDCMNRIDIITTKGGDGDLDEEKEILIVILNQLNDIKIPTSQVHDNIKSLMECRRLIQNIIESI